MARRIKDNELGSRQAREKLRPRGKPYWRSLEKGLHIGYRRIKGKAGTWSARHYTGKQQYEIETIGTADDFSDADGIVILDFWQAQNKARERMVSRARQTARQNRAADGSSRLSRNILGFWKQTGNQDATPGSEWRLSSIPSSASSSSRN